MEMTEEQAENKVKSFMYFYDKLSEAFKEEEKEESKSDIFWRKVDDNFLKIYFGLIAIVIIVYIIVSFV